MSAILPSVKQEAPRASWLRSGWTWLYAMLTVLVTAMVLFTVLRPITVLPRIALAPGYTLTDQMGRTITSESRRGKLTLYSFTYTQCTADCPLTGAQLADLRAQLSAHADGFGLPLDLVTVTLDPARDDPAVLQAFATQHGADRPWPIGWTLLTGDPARVKMVVGSGFSLFYAERDGGVQFWPRLVLVDGLGMVRAVYETADPGLEILLRDLGIVGREAQRSTGLTRLGYEAAHLFACYPR